MTKRTTAKTTPTTTTLMGFDTIEISLVFSVNLKMHFPLSRNSNKLEYLTFMDLTAMEGLKEIVKVSTKGWFEEKGKNLWNFCLGWSSMTRFSI